VAMSRNGSVSVAEVEDRTLGGRALLQFADCLV